MHWLDKNASSIFYGNDQLVRMGNIKIAAKQFADKIRVGVTRIEQRDAVLNAITLSREPGDFLLALLKQARIFTPGEQTAWSCNARSAEQQQRDKRQRLRQTVFREQRRPAGVHDFC